MPFITGGLAAGGSILSGIFGSNAATSAANTQAQAEKAAIQTQQQQFAQTTQNMLPFLQSGTTAQNIVNSLLGFNTQGGFNPASSAYFQTSPSAVMGGPAPTPPSPTDPTLTSQFQASPGYQWQRGQGINAIQNSAAGQTGALSGNMLKGLQTYGTGLANQDFWNFYNALNQNYGNLSNNYWNTFNATTAGKNTLLNQLLGIAGSGQNAAGNLGGLGAQTAATVGSGLVGQGQAVAAGQLGSANALTGGFNNALSYLLAPNANTGGTNPLAFLFGGGGYGNQDFSGSVTGY